jgi:hypothetical protein
MSSKRVYAYAFSAIAFLLTGWWATILAQAPVSNYDRLKQDYWSKLSQAKTNAERLQIYRETVARGRYSGRTMVQRMFGNFEPGKFHLRADTPGLAKQVLLLASESKAQVIGAARTIRYADMFAADARFEVVELGQLRENRFGKTDADIVVRHKATGQVIRVEVKDLSLESQKADLKRLEEQIRKMAEDAHLRGERAVLMNRKQVLPELKQIAEKYGVQVFEEVKTGVTTRGQTDFQQVANELDDSIKGAIYARRIGKVLVVAGVAISIYEEGTMLYKYYTGQINWREFVEEEARFVAGGLGGAAGAWVGFKVGAVIGSFGGPIGTAVGGFIGGVVGGIAGYIAGEKAGAWAAGTYFQWQDEKEHELYVQRLMEYCQQRYGSPSIGNAGGGGN